MTTLLFVVAPMMVDFVVGSCSNFTSCTECLGTTLSPTHYDCKWCADDAECVDKSSNEECHGSSTQCQDSYYTIIFVVVVTSLVCLCFGACCFRKCGLRDENGNFRFLNLCPILAKSSFFNNNASSAEQEWMCIICGFDNNSKSEYCTMCGTSHQFSIDYKTEKITHRKQRRKEKAKKEKVDIKIPLDAQITESSYQSYDVIRQSLSRQQRAEIFNYRRLNQLTLRQKSARRRRMWQRVFDEETGELKWVRQTVAETKVGTALFGYSPSHSFDDTYSYRLTSDEASLGSSMHDPLLQAERSQSQNFHSPPKTKTRKSHKRPDSFDDVVTSGSPGFTSLFGEEGELQWERVETGQAATRNIVAPNYTSHGKLFSPAVMPRMGRIPADNLEAAAILPYKEKQTWFVKHLQNIQRPWSDGYVRFEVNRNNLLHDSCKCMLQLKKVDLHKWMRIQFSGSSGVDAGGLEREWFGLVVTELLDPRNGLFMSSSSDMDIGSNDNIDPSSIHSPSPSNSKHSTGDIVQGTKAISSKSTSGTYHINPLSGEFISNHLDYFLFAGRLFGKSLLEQQSINAPLSLPLRKQILSLPITFSDLEFVDGKYSILNVK